MSNYRDPIIQAYLDLIKANCNGRITHFYHGEPITVPSVNLPCVIISKQETRAGHITNKEDEHGIAMTLTLIADVRSDLSTQENRDAVAAGVTTLYELIEGRNDDFTLQDHCILNILRHNSLVNSAFGLRTDLSSMTRVDYGQTLRDRAADSWTIEAKVDFVAQFIQVR